MKRFGIVSLLCIFVIKNVFTQSTFPYQFSIHKETTLLSVGIGFTAYGWHIGKKVNGLTVNQLNLLNVEDIHPRTDRSAARRWSPAAAKWSDRLLVVAALPPVMLTGSKAGDSWRQGGGVALMGLEALMLSAGLTNTVKNLVLRPRPYAYQSNVPLAVRLEADTRRSFFSGHTSTVAVASYFTAQVYADLYPDSRWKPWVWTGAATLPLAVGIQRYRAGKHFPTDILVGYAVGALCGVLTPYWHRKR